MALPLEDIRVLELSQIMAGPFCGMVLADLGADVIKVEKTEGGDDARGMGPPFAGGEGMGFFGMNRNKRSLALDLKRPRGKEVFLRLAAGADVVTENFRPGTLERLGLGYDVLREANPGVILASISGFGHTGPYRDRGGFDLIAQGMSGVMSITGHPDSPPAKSGVPLSDLNAGLFLAIGILSALHHRARTGEGQRVETSLLEGAIAYTVWDAASFFGTGEVPGPVGSAHRVTAPYQAFRAKDGYFTLGSANERNWQRLCEALGRPELARDPRFATNADRKAHEKELEALLAAIFKERTVPEWLELLENSGVPCGPLYNMEQVFADPHVRAREMVVELAHPRAGRVKHIGVPVKLSVTPGRLMRPAPLLGEHSPEVLREAGFSKEEVAALQAEGVVRVVHPSPGAGPSP